MDLESSTAVLLFSWCRSNMGTAEEDSGFRAAVSALSNERGKPAHH